MDRTTTSEDTEREKVSKCDGRMQWMQLQQRKTDACMTMDDAGMWVGRREEARRARRQ